MLFAGLGSTNKSTTFLLFSFYLTLVLSSPPCPFLHLSFYFSLFGRSGKNCLLSPPVPSGYNGFPDTRFSRETTRLMSWPDGECYLRLLQSLVVSLLLSFVSTLVFSRTGGVLSHRNSSTNRFPRLPPRNLCSFVTLAFNGVTQQLKSKNTTQRAELSFQNLVHGHFSRRTQVHVNGLNVDIIV